MPLHTLWTALPRILPSDSESLVMLMPQPERLPLDAALYTVTVYAAEELGAPAGEPAMATYDVAPTNGVLQIRHRFLAEQEHTIIITRQDSSETIGEARVYSLADDLFRRRPLKGDLHMHSNRSDGRDAPGDVAASCRRIGLDFMAVTDHRRYSPSIEAQDAFADTAHDLLICRGEEVHPPGNPTHMINFGGSLSINEQFSDDAYLRGVGEIIEGLAKLPPGVDPYQYASCVWCFQQIRETGGLGIFCHPYWYTQHRYEPAGALTSHLFRTQPYDAFELIGGYYPFEYESNWLQVARYHDERAAGRSMPIVGVSDAHGCHTGQLFGWFYTIVFADGKDLLAITNSIRGQFSVAIEHLPGQAPRAHGPFRLVKYAQFLLRHAIVDHDRLARVEGEWMARHLEGEPSARERLQALSGQCDAYWAELFAN